jgi:hypothetical protein
MGNLLYHQDFSRWTEEQAQYIQKREFDAIDWLNIEEEITALGRSEKHQLENRLEVLFEHLLKRCYVNDAYDNRGWELTIKEQRKQIRRLLRNSPSLRQYFLEILEEIWQDALSDVQDIYPDQIFPTTNSFSLDIDALLSETFWHQPIPESSGTDQGK